MKLALVGLIFISQMSFAQKLFLNSEGFSTCYETKNTAYFLHWDQFVNTQIKPVFYFEKNDYTQSTGHFIRGCEDHKYIQQIPHLILKSFSATDVDFPHEFAFSALQISQGGHKFRAEQKASEFVKKHSKLFQINSTNQIMDLRQNYGDTFTTELISVWTSQFIAKEDSCQKYIGTCDFYLCQEQKNPCGLDGYNLGYGFKYCSASKFQLLPQMISDAGQRWVSEVFQCLQKHSLLNSVKTQNQSCQNTQSAAFDSHPECYAQAGFCDLSFSDKLKIFNTIKSEIFSINTLQQAHTLLQKCHIPQNEAFILEKTIRSEVSDNE